MTLTPGRPFAAGPVARVMRSAVVVRPEDPVRTAVAAMTAAGATAVVVEGDGGRPGICTDHDLRSRVLAAGKGPDVAIGAVATAVAVTIDPGAHVADALLAMTEGGFRHLPVVDVAGRVVGMVEDVDLLTSWAASPLHLRRAALRASSADVLVAVAERLPQAWTSAAASGLDAVAVVAAMSSTVESVVRAALRLAVADSGTDDAFAWLVTGSLGRRELLPSSDVDSALVHLPAGRDAAAGRDTAAGRVTAAGRDAAAEDRQALYRVAERTGELLRRCGIAADTNGVTAEDSRAARTVAGWQEALAHWRAHPELEDAIVWTGALLDARALWGAHQVASLLADVRRAPVPAPLARRVGWAAVTVARPPVTTLAGRMGLDRRRRTDLKRAGIAPITSVARWAAYVAGSSALDTPGRLTDAHAAGVLVSDEAAVLGEAFARVQAVRLRRQVEALADGRAPDDDLAPADLDPLTRRELREAFHAVLRIQDAVHARIRDAR